MATASAHLCAKLRLMDNFTLVIFGITSNLAQIKLIPTLYDLVKGQYLNPSFRVIGVGRKEMDPTQFKEYVSHTLATPNRHHTHSIDPKIETDLLSRLTYFPADLTDPTSYQKLSSLLLAKTNRMFYLATFPSLFATIFKHLKASGLTDQKTSWARLLIEKPIGHDASSAGQLNQLLTQYFSEDQIFRLDHYLGKETLQNILTFRFSNGILEHLMNKEHIREIQVTATEDFGIGGRGSYYDQNGALKDVGQNHLLQMIALSLMDQPRVLSNQGITAERVKVLTHLVADPSSLIIGQYEGYQNEKDVAEGSLTETYFAFQAELNNDRFRGVPIYVRGGKYTTRTATEVAIIFKNSPNVLIYRIQPNEGIVLKIVTKKPGSALDLTQSYMQYCYPHDVDLPDAYENLIIDALRGDQTFFNDADEVDAQWTIIDPLVERTHRLKPIIYPRGSWGPPSETNWLEPSTAFCAI